MCDLRLVCVFSEWGLVSEFSEVDKILWDLRQGEGTCVVHVRS